MSLKMYDLAGKDPAVRFSPYCWRIKMALAHKGLPVETIPWRFTEKHVIAFSGQERVPVLVDGERLVTDSWDIALYLDETYPERPALFDGAQARAAGFFIKRWCETQLHPALARLILADIVQVLTPEDATYFRQSREAALGKSLEDYCEPRADHLKALDACLVPLRSCLKVTGFLGGATPGFADYIVFGAFQWARCSSREPVLQPGDPLAEWFGQMLGLHDGFGAKAPCAFAS
ncbi:glutathione S-transferase family protein [Pelagibius sp.]|uniref:glutathione S-transferase family protein n=1 Tax=Pelagibius sp. TaxID=1931238 RepID=UPI00260A2081|nr:glutathione S-transferase family protein [Pelagibius sp.]